MSKAWKQLDLEGAGLQRLNMTLAREMKRRPTAYALLLLFPLGLHRFYLGEPIGGTACLALSVLAVALAVTAGPAWALTALLPVVLLAAFDLLWIDRRVTRYNKALRMRRFLRPGNGPPPGFRGRHTDETEDLDDYLRLKESERAGHPPAGTPEGHGSRRVPSLNEQEAMLRELARAKKERGRKE